MKRAFEVGVLVLMIMALVVTSGQGAVIDVSGQVVDREGAPVAGAQIAMIWHFDETGRRISFEINKVRRRWAVHAGKTSTKVTPR